MKTLRWIGRSITVVALGLIGKWLSSNLDFLPVFYFAYPTAIFLGIFALILLILGFCFLEIVLHRRIKLKEAFEISKPVKKLTHDDFRITNYNKFYIKRESDKEIENLLKERKYVFITGIPMLGKTRMAYEASKKLKDFYLLKPKYEKIDIQKFKLPFFNKKIILFLDDLNKYAGKFDLDDLIRKLKKESEDFVVIATCRSGKEFDQVFAKKEMETLLTQCQKGKTQPRKLKQEEESKLATAAGKRLEEIGSDGTPGSITIDLRYMKERYDKLGHEKSILKSLKLLKEGNIFLWKENLVKEVSKGIFDLNIQRTKWDSYVNSLSDNGFIMESSGSILISHDVYLDNRFLDDYLVGDDDLESLKEILFRKLRDAENLFYLGNGFYYKKNLSKAVDCYRKSIQVHSDFAVAHYNLGLSLSDLKRYEEAEKEYKEALRINPGYADAHATLGILLYELKRYEEAEKEYREGLRINPDDAEAHNNLGVLLHELKRYDEAESEYRDALLINPDDAQAHTNLGNLLEKLKRYAEAEKEYKEALRINPDYAGAHGNLARLLMYLNRKEEAKKESEIARDLFRKQGREEYAKKEEGFLKEL